MADNANVELVTRGYEAFNDADIETLSAMFDENAVQHIPGDSVIAGDKVGRDAILGYYAQIGELTDGTFSAVLESATADGPDKVVAKHHAQGKRGDQVLDAHDTLVFTIKDGKFVDLDERSADQAVADAVWGKG